MLIGVKRMIRELWEEDSLSIITMLLRNHFWSTLKSYNYVLKCLNEWFNYITSKIVWILKMATMCYKHDKENLIRKALEPHWKYRQKM